MSDELISIAEDILTSDAFNQMSKFSHHKKTNTLQHSINVAESSLAYVNKYGIKCNKRSLVVGCLLHDLFLYDYHEKGNRITNFHAFTHPKIALRNAELHYELSPLEKEIIKKHMWPITIIPPTKKEVWIIVWQDKVCAIKELLKK
jgi:uncharacterized protein